MRLPSTTIAQQAMPTQFCTHESWTSGHHRLWFIVQVCVSGHISKLTPLTETTACLPAHHHSLTTRVSLLASSTPRPACSGGCQHLTLLHTSLASVLHASCATLLANLCHWPMWLSDHMLVPYTLQKLQQFMTQFATHVAGFCSACHSTPGMLR